MTQPAVFSQSGVLPVYKPSGITSFDVIRQIKRKIHPAKIGHGGTLDKLADGVLLILLNEATRGFDYLLKSGKRYRATVQFGAQTDTDDAEGTIINTFPLDFDPALLPPALERFRGTIRQIPPRYSALRVEGKRSYELARKNQPVNLSPREVTVYSLDLIETDGGQKSAVLDISCSSGTYIRSIARDLGQDLGWGGYLSALTRTESAGIALDDCIRLDDLSPETLPGRLVDLNTALRFLPDLRFDGDPQYIRNGQRLDSSLFDGDSSVEGFYRVTSHGELIAVIEKKDGTYRYARVFHPELSRHEST